MTNSTNFVDQVTVIQANWCNDVNAAVYSNQFLLTNYGYTIGQGASAVTAINAAISAANSSGGGVVLLPAATYTIDGSIVMKSNVTLKGSGYGTILSHTTDIDIITVASNVGKYEICNLSIERSSGTAATKAAITTQGSDGKIHDIGIYRTFDGIILAGVQNVNISACRLWGFKGTGILINDTCNDNFISKCFINGGTDLVPGAPNVDVGPGTGITLLNKSDATMISDCEVILCTTGLNTSYTGGGIYPGASTVVGCYFDSCLTPAQLQYLHLTKFTNCWFGYSRTNEGCVMTNCKGVTFNNCSFQQNVKSGCLVETSSVFSTFSNCSFTNNSRVSSGTYAGLAIGANITDFSVIGCIGANTNFNTPETASATQLHGILVTTGTSDRYVITGNLVSTNTSTGVSDNGTGVNKLVANNY